MKSTRAMQSGQRRLRRAGGAADRAGSILIAVLWLMALLWVIGIFFFMFANTEQTAATYFSDASKVEDRCGLAPDVLWDWALRQLIVGPKFDEDYDNDPTTGNYDSEQESALYAFDSRLTMGLGRHSLLYHMLGNDLQAYNGVGINLITESANPGMAFVDQDYDTVSDSQSLMNFNYSSAANGGAMVDVDTLTVPPPASDVGYTYPDINAMFLAYNAPVGPGPNGILGDGDDTPQIIIPSFQRPQYLRLSGAPVTAITGWDTDPTTASRVFRPHRDHQSTAGGDRYLATRFTKPDGTFVDPFPFTTTADGNNQIVFQEGVWTAEASYSYDTDADGDGIKEAIWIPLAFPVQECDGKRFVPMFAYTVYDADGLINLNVAGNTSGTRITGNLNPSTTTRFHQSNQALTPSELSLHYALNGVPDSSVSVGSARWEPYNQIFGIADPTTVSRDTMANMDTFVLLRGRGEYDAGLSLDGTLLGRYGDRNELLNALSTLNLADFPQPGTPLVDDDSDLDIVASNDPSNTAADNQPLENSGAGTFVDQTTSNYGTKPLRLDLGVDPNRWIQYLDYDVTSTYVGYDDTFANLLSWTLGAPIRFNLDEADESVLVSGFPTESGTDAQFAVEEMAGLHKSDADPDANLVTSRLKDLLINFNESTGAADRRKQFTTISWDRIELGLRQALSRPWEMSNDFPPLVSTLVDTDPAQPFRQPVIDLFAINPGADGIATPIGLQRKLDLNRHLYRDVNDNKLKFRELTPHPTDPGRATIPTTVPAFPPVTAVDQEYWARRDRQEKARDIYVLLYMLCGGMDTTVGADGQPGVTGVDDDGLNGIDDLGELGWPGSDDVSYLSSNVGNVLYTVEQLRQMAQFAVNLVDALDADNVMSKFEFDMDLSNGWNVDDNPYTSSGELDRGVVFGVEAQSLTFSEALMFKATHVGATTGENHDATLHNDSYDRMFTYLELRNASPLPVETGTILSDSTSELGRHWRIRMERTDVTDPMNPISEDSTITNTLTLSAGQIAGGALFTIGNNGSSPTLAFPDPNRIMPDIITPTDPARTELWVDPIFNGTLGTRERIIPRIGAGNLDLDLSFAPENGTLAVPYRLNAGDVVSAAVVSGVWDKVTPVDPGAWFDLDNRVEITFILERRANLTREAPRVATTATLTTVTQQEIDNPWVEVDRIKVDRSEFALQVQTAPNPTDVQSQLAVIRSFERDQPIGFIGVNTEFERRYSDVHTAGNYSNSVGDVNESTLARTGSEFGSWQPHFDRHFASAIELLSIPLYAPADLTSHVLLDDTDPPANPILLNSEMGILPDPPPVDRVRRRIAQEKFLFPDFDPLTSPPDQFDNRWHRLFEFLEVPSQMHEALGEFTADVPLTNMSAYTVAELDSNPNGVDMDRVPGKLNLNTLRHPGALAAMIDDPLVHNLYLNPASGSPDTGRNWWYQFIRARDAVLLPGGAAANGGDGRDPVTGQYLPGVAGTRPFRDFADIDHGNLSIEHTLLRSLLADLPADGFSDQASRRLFEVGSQTEHTNNTIDYYMRHRLLSKVMNQSTTRSHVFIVFIAVDFFEVIDDTPGDGVDNPKIGAKLADSPGHRGFFIVDISDPLQSGAYTPPSVTVPRGRFDFRKFVRYRRTIQ